MLNELEPEHVKHREGGVLPMWSGAPRSLLGGEGFRGKWGSVALFCWVSASEEPLIV